MEAPHVFDAHIHPVSLNSQDLESLHFFGVRRVLLFADPLSGGTSKGILAQLDALVEVERPRFAKAGLEAFVAVGIHPRSVPRRGLNEVLAALPAYFRGGKVLALGETGLHLGGEEEEEAFTAQLTLALELKLRVVVHTPLVEKERRTRRILTLLRESEIPPELVLVDHANGRTVRLITACGFHAGLTLHPEELSVRDAVALIRKLGTGQLILNSDSGDRAGDFLAVPRAASLLFKAGLSAKVVERAAWRNAEAFFGL